MKTIRFGLIGCGLMAREFASAAARWCHFTVDIPKPEIVGICSVVPKEMEWFKKNFDSIQYAVEDYKELLNKDEISHEEDNQLQAALKALEELGE